MEARNPITAVILSGGKSTRMKSEKGLVMFNGKEMVQYAVGLVNPLFYDAFIIANDPAYMKFELPVYEDLVTGTGPLGGIFTGLTYSTTPWNFIIACDMPFMTAKVIEKLVNNISDNDLVIASHEQSPEPLCALYNKSALTVIEKQLAARNYKLQELLPLLRLKEVDFTKEFQSESNPFRNINTQEELFKLNKS